MFLLAVTWIVYKSYGLSGTGFWNIIALQTMIGVAVEMLPLPGAAGVTEGCFTYMFMGIFTAELVKPAMLLSRGLSFYLLLIMSALVTFVAHFIVMRNDKKNGKCGTSISTTSRISIAATQQQRRASYKKHNLFHLH